MNVPPPLTAVVELKKSVDAGEIYVKVGISICLGTDPKMPHFTSTLPPSLIAGTEYTKSSEEIYIQCTLAAVNGVVHLRRIYAEPFDYHFTAFEGRDLQSAATVGFCLAATKAAAKALGVPTSSTEAEGFGWFEVDKPLSNPT